MENTSHVQGGHGGPGAGGGSSAPDPAAGQDEPSMAVPVTRHAVITEKGEQENEEWKVLGVGVDSLDLCLDVHWGKGWPRLADELEHGRLRAEGSKGVLWRNVGLGPCLIQPYGKPPMYRFCVQPPDFICWIGKTEKPKGSSGNVYVSIRSETLWRYGLILAIAMVKTFIGELGGEVLAVKPSRVDLCVDLLIPAGLSMGFLESHLVSRSRKIGTDGEPGKLETFRVGDKGAPLLCRVYDKSKEIEQASGKAWFFDIWGIPPGPGVWRFEFQLRRPALRQFHVGSVEKLIADLGGLWRYLTEDWMSLRLADNDNDSRRTVHPGWALVKLQAAKFGEAVKLSRDFNPRSETGRAWYVSHVAGCLVGFAALLGERNPDHAIGYLLSAVREYWALRDFDEQYVVQCVRRGLPVEGGDDAAPF